MPFPLIVMQFVFFQCGKIQTFQNFSDILEVAWGCRFGGGMRVNGLGLGEVAGISERKTAIISQILKRGRMFN
jgi:hypothetical protein